MGESAMTRHEQGAAPRKEIRPPDPAQSRTRAFYAPEPERATSHRLDDILAFVGFLFIVAFVVVVLIPAMLWVTWAVLG